MEAPISDQELRLAHHDAKRHGPVWFLLNQLLHLIVLVYACFGMIRFKVKFIHMVRLVRWLTVLTVVHSWYLSVKFALIAFLSFAFNFYLSANGIAPERLQCALTTVLALPEAEFELVSNRSPLVALLVGLLDSLGGPFRLLGYSSSIMYGFYTITIFTMLAIFPLELVYLDIGFNYIRFVLNDLSCMEDLFRNKQRHLDRLSLWSRNENSSLLTLSVKKNTNRRRLRSPHVAGERPAAGAGLAAGQSSSPLRSLRLAMAVNHSNEPSYGVKIANRNLAKFKPHTRSESWFKLSMVVYPIFIFFYFAILDVVCTGISLYFVASLEKSSRSCAARLADASFDLFANWTTLDRLTYYETHYAVFAVSCSSSFYCSYYFGTILELYVWLTEIEQQLDLCRLVLEFSSDEELAARLAHLGWRPARHRAHQAAGACSHFGGIGSLSAYWRWRSSGQKSRLEGRQLMALGLMNRRQTLMRATYINMSLFFDELRDTRFMVETILRRTTQIAFGFALMVSITKSQFVSNYMSMLLFLGAALFILNLYLICAAVINTKINKFSPQIHAIVNNSLAAETDHDMLEFWIRHIEAYGTDIDAMGYSIYGYKITWSRILNFNGTVTSCYLWTVY